MFGAIQQHLRQCLIHNFSTRALSSWRNNNDDRVTVHKTPPFSKHELHVYARQSDIFHLSSSIAFLIKRDEIHVKNKEKPTFLILKVNYILRTALSESPVTLLKFEHLSNQRTKTTLWSVRDTCPKRSDWYANINVIFFKIKKKNTKIVRAHQPWNKL